MLVARWLRILRRQSLIKPLPKCRPVRGLFGSGWLRVDLVSDHHQGDRLEDQTDDQPDQAQDEEPEAEAVRQGGHHTGEAEASGADHQADPATQHMLLVDQVQIQAARRGDHLQDGKPQERSGSESRYAEDDRTKYQQSVIHAYHLFHVVNNTLAR